MKPFRAAALLGIAALLSSSCSSAGSSAGRVEDHVHAVAAGPGGSVLLATHYGLETSSDGGRTWQPDPGLGDQMVAGLLALPEGYVASVQPMSGASMAMTAADMSLPGMQMGEESTGNIGYTTGPGAWRASRGIPVGAAVAALTSVPGTEQVWASLIGLGVYESNDGGGDWSRVLPSTVPISGLAASGPNLVMALPSGIFVTSRSGPSMPGLAELDGPVNDVEPLPTCSTCLIAALGGGGVAISRDAGVTWAEAGSSPAFDELSAPSGSESVFGLVPSPGDPDHGVWRSSDGGHTWSRVVTASLIDHLYALPGRPETLLAFEWGINVLRSDDDGADWTPLSHITAP